VFKKLTKKNKEYIQEILSPRIQYLRGVFEVSIYFYVDHLYLYRKLPDRNVAFSELEGNFLLYSRTPFTNQQLFLNCSSWSCTCGKESNSLYYTDYLKIALVLIQILPLRTSVECYVLRVQCAPGQPGVKAGRHSRLKKENSSTSTPICVPPSQVTGWTWTLFIFLYYLCLLRGYKLNLCTWCLSFFLYVYFFLSFFLLFFSTLFSPIYLLFVFTLSLFSIIFRSFVFLLSLPFLFFFLHILLYN
jgi:hypothetical protein